MSTITATLRIYVSEDCPGCTRARSIAQAVQSHRPGVAVEVIDLMDGHPIPPQVFSVPTYLLNGQVVSLGNPRLDELLASLPAAS